MCLWRMERAVVWNRKYVCLDRWQTLTGCGAGWMAKPLPDHLQQPRHECVQIRCIFEDLSHGILGGNGDHLPLRTLPGIGQNRKGSQRFHRINLPHPARKHCTDFHHFNRTGGATGVAQEKRGVGECLRKKADVPWGVGPKMAGGAVGCAGDAEGVVGLVGCQLVTHPRGSWGGADAIEETIGTGERNAVPGGDVPLAAVEEASSVHERTWRARLLDVDATGIEG